jgi:hypothetical protein
MYADEEAPQPSRPERAGMSAPALQASGPNQLWVADFTYVATWLESCRRDHVTPGFEALLRGLQRAIEARLVRVSGATDLLAGPKVFRDLAA